jgi:hypothetical protein
MEKDPYRGAGGSLRGTYDVTKITFQESKDNPMLRRAFLSALAILPFGRWLNAEPSVAELDAFRRDVIQPINRLMRDADWNLQVAREVRMSHPHSRLARAYIRRQNEILGIAGDESDLKFRRRPLILDAERTEVVFA